MNFCSIFDNLKIIVLIGLVSGSDEACPSFGKF